MRKYAHRHLFVAAAALLTTAGFPPQSASSADLLVEGIERFRAGSASWDYAAFTNAAALFEQAARRDTDSHAAHYWHGAALFHAALHRIGNGSDTRPDRVASSLMRDAAQSLDAALVLQPDDPESHALLSTLIGMLISANPLTAVWRGPAVLRHRDKALRGDPNNPRTYYLIGSGYFHTPGLSGNRDMGLAMFLKAAELFEVEKTLERDVFAPRWGHDHCLAFIGRVHEEKQDRLNAMRYYREALVMNPTNRMAREGVQRCQTEHPENPSP